jgi:iron complex outermembrane receptor protein
LLCGALAASPAYAQSIDDLRTMSIDELAEVSVSSVSKSEEPLGDAPASIYVIDHDAIVRSGAATLPEMLRLAPNLQVFQTNPGKWVVTPRGLNGNPGGQSYSNKLLVLVDGRPVYTPLFSGVYWDMPDVLPDSVDRIEVISGPGATLWGANAVNGVINVITRGASELDRFHADFRAGPDRQMGGLRVAGAVSDRLAFEVHARAMREDAALIAGGASAQDPWNRLGGGFRLDWTPSDADLVSFQGDIFDGRVHQPGATREDFSGRNLTLRWNRQLSAASGLQAQVFYDRIGRDSRSSGGGRFRTDTFDAELQHSLTAGPHRIVWGGGARLVDYTIDGTSSFFFVPASRRLFIGNAFVQDNFELTPRLTVTAGIKAERLPYAGTSLLPELRLAWKPRPALLIWGAASRAVRSPTPFDTEVQERAGIVSLGGNPQFSTEKLTSLEFGVRMQPARTFSLSATAFYHRYNDLRTVEIVPGPGLSLSWGNGIAGETYGVEAWADWRPLPWWTLGGGVTVLERDFHFKPGASGIIGTSQLGSDPPYRVTLRSSMNLGGNVNFDLNFRAVGALPDPAVQAYQEVGGRLAWQATPHVALSVEGTNLLEKSHQEYPGGDFIPRRIMAGAELSF